MSNKQRIFFSSDYHFGHKNVIKFANRPFASVEEMNEEMINRHNSVVRANDLLYIIGDFSFLPVDKTVEILKRMKGAKIFVPGNHDKVMNHQDVRNCFQHFYPYDCHPQIKIEDASAIGGYQTIVLNHFAMKVWNKSAHRSFHLYGHSHGSMPDDINSLSMDVGVDCWDYYPVSYEQVKLAMSKKVWKPIDHHRAD